MAPLPEHKWTMVIDLDRCTGCSACIVACHAENNVPIQDAQQIVKGRGVHWIRVERYWEQGSDQARARLMPVTCQQCNRAPCESVCPVFASAHSERQHLNLQVYNRCVGTRYCGNNDPYKVRFFNYYAPVWDSPLEQQLNPDCTTRSAGVMEKCTFCIQRISRAERTAVAEGRPMITDEVIPACVQTCPPNALIFGDMNDPNSKIHAALEGTTGRQFRLLEELGTEPAIYYLKGGETNVGG